MPKILLVKTSSLGDLIHAMPAISDLQRLRPDVELHWLVEEGLADIPAWHPFVQKVHRCAIRRWRKSFFSMATQREIRALKQSLQAEQFDAVVDAQGLLKSALMVRWLSCGKHGYDKASIREPLASHFYTHRYTISRELGAIERVRRLLSQAIGYSLDQLPQQFGMRVAKPEGLQLLSNQPYAVFLHGTVWNSKVWPVAYWNELARKLRDAGCPVFVAWGNAEEFERARLIADGSGAVVLDRVPLNHLAYHLQNAEWVIGSDTGLSHVAAALATRTIGLYGSTSVQLTGLIGDNVLNLASTKECSPCLKRECPLIQPGEMIPCYASVSPDRVMMALQEKMGFAGVMHD